MSDSRKALGIKHTESHKQHLSKKLTGTKKPQEQVTCPHCGKTGGVGNMNRYHFDFCKQNPDRKPVDERYISKKRTPRPQPKVTCPHCGQTGAKNNMNRYHFDNCKNKEEK